VKTEKPREIAVRVLQQWQQGTDYAEKLLEKELAENALSGADRALCQELVLGIARWQRTLDWLVSAKTDGRKQNATLRALLHLGLYQIFWLERIPDHAAVNETVEIAKRLGSGPRAGFLNAVLRRCIRERDATIASLESLKQTDPALGYSHPAWLVERWTQRWGADSTQTLLEWNNRPPPLGARVNELKTNFADLSARWQEEGIEFQPGPWDWARPPLAFTLTLSRSLAETRSFVDGLFYIQDPSTLLAPQQLNPQPGETILDMCAAPGGKTTYLAQLMQNRGRIVAWDAQPTRLELVRENCQRLGVTCVEFGTGQPQTAAYDKILIDAPCSNTGVLRRRADARWRLQPAELTRLRGAQLSLLAHAAPQLKPGGSIVYSTCSLEPDENENVIRDFLAAHPHFKLAQERQLTPFADQADGAYVARLTF
jgi:16S rRNA (cytosine967-C5)-methyltransferase